MVFFPFRFTSFFYQKIINTHQHNASHWLSIKWTILLYLITYFTLNLFWVISIKDTLLIQMLRENLKNALVFDYSKKMRFLVHLVLDINWTHLTVNHMAIVQFWPIWKCLLNHGQSVLFSNGIWSIWICQIIQ